MIVNENETECENEVVSETDSDSEGEIDLDLNYAHHLIQKYNCSYVLNNCLLCSEGYTELTFNEQCGLPKMVESILSLFILILGFLQGFLTAFTNLI